jgi:predicted ester cyclase
MLLPVRVTLCSPGLITSFTLVEHFVGLPFPNDQVIFMLPDVPPLPCRIDHINHYCDSSESADQKVCLIILDRTLLTNDQYSTFLGAFYARYKVHDVEHIESEDDTLYRKVCEILSINFEEEYFEFEHSEGLQHFCKMIAETFRAILIAEIAPIVKDFNIVATNSVVVATHNALLDNRDRNGKRINLKQALMELDRIINSEGLYSWNPPKNRLAEALDVVFSRAGISLAKL